MDIDHHDEMTRPTTSTTLINKLLDGAKADNDGPAGADSNTAATNNARTTTRTAGQPGSTTTRASASYTCVTLSPHHVA